MTREASTMIYHEMMTDTNTLDSIQNLESETWESYPFNQADYLAFRNPRTEFGHQTILEERFSGSHSSFRVIDCFEDGSVEAQNFCRTTDNIDMLLTATRLPLIRIFVFTQRYDCPKKSWHLTSRDLKKIFTRYHVQPSFLLRLKSFKFSAGPVMYRTYSEEKSGQMPSLKSHGNFSRPDSL